MTVFNLGDKVRFDMYLKRVHAGANARKWVPIHTGPSGHELFGIVIGKRTVSDGSWSWDEYGANYAASNYIQGYLVAYDLYRKPLLVLPNDLRIDQ